MRGEVAGSFRDQRLSGGRHVRPDRQTANRRGRTGWGNAKSPPLTRQRLDIFVKRRCEARSQIPRILSRIGGIHSASRTFLRWPLQKDRDELVRARGRLGGAAESGGGIGLGGGAAVGLTRNTGPCRAGSFLQNPLSRGELMERLSGAETALRLRREVAFVLPGA